MMDKALQVLRKSNYQKQEDSFDIFGKHVANKIRSLDNANVQCWVKFKIQEIIFQPQFNPHVQIQMTCSKLVSFTAPQRASQSAGYPVSSIVCEVNRTVFFFIKIISV